MINVYFIEIQTPYTVKRNALMPYNNVLDQKHHRAPFYKRSIT